MMDEIEDILARADCAHYKGDKLGYLVRLVTGMMTRPDKRGGDGKSRLSKDEIVRKIEELGFANWNQPLCWVDRDGLVMPAYQFSHEWVLHWLGMDARDAEDRGWVRLGETGWQCLYKVSPAQRKALRARGHSVERSEEIEKRPWHGLPPFDPSIHPSRRVREV